MANEIINFLSIELTVLLTAAMPVIELRGAIPLAISLGLSPLHAMLISLLGSMIPVPIILFGIRPVLNYLKAGRIFRNVAHKLTNTSLSGNGARIQKYGVWGLILVVAVPLPGTGVWSGSLAAALLDIRFKWAFPAILAGNIIAALAVIGISNGVINVFGN